MTLTLKLSIIYIPASPGVSCTFPMDLLRFPAPFFLSPLTEETISKIDVTSSSRLSSFFRRFSVPWEYFFMMSSSMASMGLHGRLCALHMFACVTSFKKAPIYDEWRFAIKG